MRYEEDERTRGLQADAVGQLTRAADIGDDAMSLRGGEPVNGGLPDNPLKSEEPAESVEEDPVAEALDSTHLWPGDAGTLPHDARAALLRLVKGPYISEAADAPLWRALLNYTEPIRSRLADLFLELAVDAEAGVAFARNVSAEGRDFPKAATSYTMTLLDSIMVLLLRKELQAAGSQRAFIGKAELFDQMGQYRAIEKMDQAAYLKKLEASWARLADRHRLLIKSDVEGRFEISPVLKLVFGAEEAAAVFTEYQLLRDEAAGVRGKTVSAGDDAGSSETAKAKRTAKAKGTAAMQEGGTLFDGLE